MSRPSLRIPRLLLLLAATFAPLVAWPAVLCAQDPAPAQVQKPDTSAAAIAQRIDGIKADETLAADLKTSLLEVYTRALDAAREADAEAARLAQLIAARDNAPEDLKRTQDELKSFDDRKPGPESPTQDLAALEKGLSTAQQQLAEASRMITQLDAQPGERTERRAAIQALLAGHTRDLEALPAQIPNEAEIASALLPARRTLRQAERRRLQALIDALVAERDSFQATEELLRAQRDLAARRATFEKDNVRAWQAALQEQRAAAARTEAQQAAATAADVDPRLKKIAEENIALADEATRLTADLARIESERLASSEALRKLANEYQDVQRRTKLLGSTESVGRMLRRSSAQLRTRRIVSPQQLHARAEILAHAQEQSLDYDEARLEIVRDKDKWLADALPEGTRISDLPSTVLTDAQRLRDSRKDTLQRLVDGYNKVLDTYSSVEIDEQQYETTADEYRAFVTEHALGIRSSPPIWEAGAEELMDSLTFLGDASGWAQAGRDVLVVLVQDLWPLLVVLPLVVLIAMAPLLRRRLTRHGESALRGTNVSYLPTALAFVATVLIALPIPALLAFAAWRLRSHSDTSDYGLVLAGGMRETSVLLLLLLGLRAMMRPKGLGEAHFRWQATTIQHIRRSVPLLLPAAFPLSFLLGAIETHSRTLSLGVLGSAVLITILAMVTLVEWRALHPSSGIVGGGMTKKQTALYRGRWLWFLLGAGTPAVLLTMAVWGYDYSALQLTRRLLYTIIVVIAGACVQALVLRRLVLERRRLQIRTARERMAAAKAGADPAAPGETIEVPDIDPQSLAQQTQTLLRGAIAIIVVVAAFQIWIDVLPALGILRTVPLWTIDAGGVNPETITLADVLLSLFVLGGGMVAARNLPGVLELLVLQRLRMQAGERNAVTTLARYGIFILGVLFAFSAIGIGWSKVQWLIAAVSVGLGFGLQEIFANFVSGLILLFERPIRVGDLVSVGEVTGRVRQIKIRATTIQDWDLKELVVPNREFVTGHFVNWTLGDAVVRWTVPVGVAYGSDTHLALELLLRAAQEEPDIEDTPAPEAQFVNFGESSLDLQLRVFVDMDKHNFGWRTRLHSKIDALFREHGIEIAFPQRDVHLDIRGPLLELMQNNSGRATAGTHGS